MNSVERIKFYIDQVHACACARAYSSRETERQRERDRERDRDREIERQRQRERTIINQSNNIRFFLKSNNL